MNREFRRRLLFASTLLGAAIGCYAVFASHSAEKPAEADAPRIGPIAAAGSPALAVPLEIPLQRRAEPTGDASAGIDSENGESSEPWQAILADYRSLAPDSSESESIWRNLAALWSSQPRSIAAVKAFRLALGTLSAEHSSTESHAAARLFLALSVRYPETYFAPPFEASSQTMFVRAVEDVAAQGQRAEAWLYCLRVRWLATRIDRIAPACQNVIRTHPELRLSADTTLALLPETVEHKTLPIAAADPEITAAYHDYLSDPFSAEGLSKLADQLSQVQAAEISDALMQELLQLNPEAFWRTDVPSIRAEHSGGASRGPDEARKKGLLP